MRIRWPRIPRILVLIAICSSYYVVFHLLGIWTWRTRNIHQELQADIVSQTEHHQPGEKSNLVYIKMIKCASETLDAMFHRFALVRNLECVLPVANRLYLGWPYGIETSFYRPSRHPDGHFNILSDHAVYSKALKTIMPKDTVYITSLREPFSQFKSMFNYYNLQTIMGIALQDPLAEYFSQQEKYEAIYKKPNFMKFCIPDNFTMTRNLMSFNLGFPTGFPLGTPNYTSNRSAINHWLRKITDTFSFVIIVEYFDESLVMLKRLMGWNFKDILYLSRNVENYDYKNNQRDDLIEKYKEWSAVDYALYNKYLAIFNERLKTGGQDLIEEINHYKHIRQKLQTSCDEAKSVIKFERSQWNEPFILTRPFCILLKDNLMDTLKAIYDQQNLMLNIQDPSKHYC